MNTLPPEIQYEIAILLDIHSIQALVKSRVMDSSVLDAVATKVGQDLVKSLYEEFWTRQTNLYTYANVYIIKSIDIKNNTMTFECQCSGTKSSLDLMSFKKERIVLFDSKLKEEFVLAHLGNAHKNFLKSLYDS